MITGINSYLYPSLHGHIDDISQLDPLVQGYSVFRAMDWMETNDTMIKGRPERKVKSSIWDMPQRNVEWEYTGGSWKSFGGVPLRIIVEFCNRNNLRAWVNIPYASNIGLLESIVSYCKEHCKLRPIFEYGNELWNSQFYQHRYAIEHGWGSNNLDRVIHFMAQRNRKLYSAVDGGGDVVLSGWHNSPSYNKSLLKAHSEGSGAFFDAFATAPYYGHGVKGESSWGGACRVSLNKLQDDLIDQMNSLIVPNMKENSELANKFNKPLWAYESGQHLVASNESEKSLFLEWRKSPLFQEADSYFRGEMRSIGYKIDVRYAIASKWGDSYWGVTDLNDI